MDNTRLIVAYVLRNKLTKFINEAKLELDEKLSGDSNEVLATFDLDFQELDMGSIRKTKPKKGWIINDLEAFTDWVEANRPELGEHIFTVTQAGQAKILDEINEVNKPITDDGELIPGVVWGYKATPSLRINPSKEIESYLGMIAAEGRMDEILHDIPGIEQ